jgi:hypothetical protein
MTRFSLISLALGLLALGACADPYAPTPRPDYTIRVMSTPKGDIALPPPCPSWATATTDPYDNQLLPQYGCANARNLALAVERPSDLVRGRDLGPQRGVTAVGAIRRYDNDQTRGLLYLSTSLDTAVDATTSSSASSPLTGDVTGGASSTSSSSSSSSSSSPPSTSSAASGY